MQKLLIFISFAFIFAGKNLPDAPGFSLYNMQQKRVSSKAFYGAENGKVTLVSFFSVACKPCLKEQKHLVKLAKEFPEANFLLLNFKDKKPAIRQWLKKHDSGLPILLDTYGVVGKNFDIIQEEKGRRSAILPYAFIITPDGKIVYKNSGFTKGDEIMLKFYLKRLFEK